MRFEIQLLALFVEFMAITMQMFCNHQNIHVCHASNSNKQSMYTRFSRISGRNNAYRELNSVINQGNHEKLVISMLGLQNWRMFSSKKD